MTEQTLLPIVDEPEVKEAMRQPYAPPRLVVHGTLQTLTQGGTVGGGDPSGVPDGG